MTIITKRCWRLFFILLIGLSLVWLVPKSGVFAYSMLSEELPEQLNELVGVDLKVTGKELKILADDTTFARKRYYNPYDRTTPFMDISVVFSGKDINNSLHRPEICLKAQGWNFLSEDYVVLKGVMPDGGDLPMKQIVCEQKLEDESMIKKVQYYTFFGNEKVVSGHYERTFEDIKTRLLKGRDQQWAYVTFSMSDTHVYEGEFGKRMIERHDVLQCEEALTKFITSSVPYLIKDKE